MNPWIAGGMSRHTDPVPSQISRYTLYCRLGWSDTALFGDFRKLSMRYIFRCLAVTNIKEDITP